MIEQTLGAAALSLIVQGTSLHADYLRGTDTACVMSARSAQQWQKLGRAVVQQRIGPWCVSGTVEQGYWIAEQWRDQPTGAQGWRIRIPLGNLRQSGVFDANAWGLDVIDPAIASRIRYRQSSQVLARHHLDSAALMGAHHGAELGAAAASHDEPIRAPLRLTQLNRGTLLLSGRHPDGGSYSVVIERGVSK